MVAMALGAPEGRCKSVGWDREGEETDRRGLLNDLHFYSQAGSGNRLSIEFFRSGTSVCTLTICDLVISTGNARAHCTRPGLLPPLPATPNFFHRIDADLCMSHLHSELA